MRTRPSTRSRPPSRVQSHPGVAITWRKPSLNTRLSSRHRSARSTKLRINANAPLRSDRPQRNCGNGLVVPVSFKTPASAERFLRNCSRAVLEPSESEWDEKNRTDTTRYFDPLRKEGMIHPVWRVFASKRSWINVQRRLLNAKLSGRRQMAAGAQDAPIVSAGVLVFLFHKNPCLPG